MNPNQPLGNPGTGGTVTPPGTPPLTNSGAVSDIPENGFGFTDEQPELPQVVRPAAPTQPLPVTPRPAPQLTAPPRPLIPQPAPLVAPVPAPAVPFTPQTPVPAPALPTQAVPIAVPAPTPPVAVMPPQVPVVPTLSQPALNPVVPVPAQQASPAPQPTAYATPVSITQAPFDPATVSATATSTPVNPITTSYNSQPVTHLPTDIADRINEKPMQNSGDILRQIKHGLDGSRVKSILSFIVFIVAIFAAAFLINQYVFQSYYVEGTSMTPTLQNNDRLIISKVERTMAGIQGKPYIPERGQIVVLDSSIIGLNGQHEQLIKRVVGLPGDRVHIEAGTVIITNTEHPDGYDVTQALGLTNLHATYADEPIDLTVPEGHVYVMGDNREQGGSYDSRSFGPIEGNQIQGRLWGRILPLDKAQLY